MNRDDLRQLVGDVFGPNTDTKEINGWLSMKCPLAPWTHESRSDSRASSGISIKDNDTSVFNCYTCKVKVPLQALIRKYADYTGEDLDEIIAELEDEAYLGPRELPGWGSTKTDIENANDLPIVLDKEIYLDLYDPVSEVPEALAYCEGRGITAETCDKLQLMYDPSSPSDHEPRILFPVFGPDGQLHGLSGRALHKDALLKVKDYAGLEKAKCLLGAHLITSEKPDKVLVVEGLFDYANGWQCGQPVVAVMHSTLTPAQARLLTDFGLPTYLFYDDDQAGQSGVELAGAQLEKYMPVMRVRYPEVWIEDENEDGGGHWLKDPGEMIPEDFTEMIKDSRLF